MTAPDFGLESLYRLQPIESKKNALILLVHFVLSKNGWLYVGRGTEWGTGKLLQKNDIFLKFVLSPINEQHLGGLLLNNKLFYILINITT